MDIDIQDVHYKKYLKYKLKYLELKQQSGGWWPYSYFFPNNTNQTNQTKQTLAYFKKKQIELEPKNYLDLRLLNATTPLIHNLIPNLINDLINEKSAFNKELLNNFVTLPNFTIIKYDINDQNLKNNNILVNFTTNFYKIANIYKYKGSLDRKDVDNINFFNNELTHYIDQNLINMEYKEELKEILTIYLKNFEKLYNLKK